MESRYIDRRKRPITATEEMKNNKAEIERLTEIFKNAGAKNPQSWAVSQVEEGIPQLALFSFAKALWEGVVNEHDSTWINNMIRSAEYRPDAPLSSIGLALKAIREKGVSDQAITDLVRGIQYQALFHACSVISGTVEADVPMQDWMLFEVDEEENPVKAMDGTHEILLSLDPTGREMRPREKQ